MARKSNAILFLRASAKRTCRGIGKQGQKMKNQSVVKITPIAISLLMILSGISFARIGETLDECKKRYGEPVKAEEGFTYFRKADLIIQVSFFKTKVDFIRFAKSKDDEHFTDNEIKLLLDANGAGAKWEDIQSNLWGTKSGLFATIDQKNQNLTLATKEGFERLMSEKKEKEDKSLEGF